MLHGGRIEFAPNRRANWGWALLSVYLVYAFVGELKGGHRRPFDLIYAAAIGIIAVMVIFTFPGTIIATPDGLEQISWLWRNKQIRWAEIAEINTGEKRRTVTVTGADGTKIVHHRHLADRPGLLMTLKEHGGENLPSDFPREPTTGF